MKAIQVKQVGGPEAMQVAELPVPQPKPNEAVVKLAASGVNFIDVYFREGRYKAPLPLTLGQEGAGVVTAVGAEVKSVKAGDRVAWAGLLGSYAECAAVAVDRLVPIPQGVTDQQAVPVARYVSAEARRDGAGTCRGGWRGTAPGADGAQHRGARDRDGFYHGKGEAGARRRSR